MNADIGDTPIHRKDISEMTDEQIDEMLVGIRERRLKLVQQYQEAQLVKKEKSRTKAIETLDRQCEMFEKELATLDKNIGKLEKRALNIRALRLEIED